MVYTFFKRNLSTNIVNKYIDCLLFISVQKDFKSLIYFLITLIIISTLSKPSNAELTIFDVGQGDSILFKSNTNKTVLIDTGGKGEENFEFKHHNIAKYKILPSLKRRGITTIDYLIITHPHADHMGNFLIS